MRFIHILKIILLSATLLTFSQCGTETVSTEKEDPLTNLLADIEAFETANYPLDSLSRGFHIKGNIKAINSAAFERQLTEVKAFIEQANALPELTEEDKINKAVLLYKLQNEKSNLEFKNYLIPLSAEGGFFNEVNFILPSMPFRNTEDYKAYLGWLPKYAAYLKDHQKLLQEGMDENWVASEVVAINTLKLLKVWLKNPEYNSPFANPFHHFPETVSEEDQDVLWASLKSVLDEEIYPAYDELLRFIATDYLPKCIGIVGISDLENGKSFYENRVQHFTTLQISPDSVFNLGLAEVDRIKALMIETIEESGFNGSFEEYINFLRTDEQYYAKTPEEILHYAAWLSKKAEEKLPQYFEHLYSNPFTVSPVPKAIAPQYTAGRYSSGSLAKHTVGEYWVNTYNLPARPLYALPSLTLHEAVPGHHLHHALTEEIEGLPEFRRHFYISAFGEGWALYCEFLGEEMEMYNTPAEWFGRYTYEMWRACRLVVDVGLHYKDWTREQAVAYLASNTALSIHEVNTEIDRYIGWPGQALSYKMGELKIKSIRKLAEEQLSDDFDIRAFHNKILSEGSVPLDILDQFMNEWIQDQKEAFSK